MSEGAPQTLSGRVLGPCRLGPLIGRGGGASVYEGRHLTLERPVAVKVIESPRPDWLSEARLAAALDDPRIVAVYDAGEDAGTAYIVMQLAEGESLEALVRRAGPLPPQRALAVAREVSAALAHAHAKGVVHRDVKPANILIDQEGRVKLTDFGLAAAVAADAGEAAGSWDFMAPEQAFGAPPDPRMDLYALGATLFYALAGRPAFQAESPQDLIVMHREAPVPDVRAFSPKATAAVSELVRRLMAKRPEARPADAREVLALLGSHRMELDVDATGSPFELLPPPPEEEASGLAAEQPPAEAQASAAGAPVIPAALPPEARPVEGAGKAVSPWAPRAAAAVAFIALFGRHWLGAGLPDALAAAPTAALALAWAAGRAGTRRGLVGAFWAAALAAALGAYARAGGLPPFEGWLAAGLGAAALVGGWLVGPEEKALSRLLCLAGAALLAAAAASCGAGAEEAFGAVLSRRLGADAQAFSAGGGWWRWSGAALVGAAWVFFRGRKAPQGPAPAIANWYRN